MRAGDGSVRTASWDFSLARCTWRTVFTFTSPKKERMQREPRAILTARPCDSRKRAVGDHVHARRFARAVVHRNARHARHDRWKHHNTHSHVAGSRIHFREQDLSKQSSAHDLLTHQYRP